MTHNMAKMIGQDGGGGGGGTTGIAMEDYLLLVGVWQCHIHPTPTPTVNNPLCLHLWEWGLLYSLLKMLIVEEQI